MEQKDRLQHIGYKDLKTEDEADRTRREAEPGIYALTYEEARTVIWTRNIIDTVFKTNNFIELDETTGEKIYPLTAESIKAITDAFESAGLDPDELLQLSERVLSSNWYTLMITNQDHAGREGLGFSILACINGKTESGFLPEEEYAAVYDGSSREEQRKALHLPKNTLFLYSAEQSTLETLRQVCNAQPLLESRIGYLRPYDMMPNPASFGLVSRFINDPHMANRSGRNSTVQISEELSEGGREYIIRAVSNNHTTTLTITDFFQFLEAPSDDKTAKKRRGTLQGVKKVWRFAIQKLMQQSVNQITPETITIDLEEMVSLGMFTNVDNAYRAIDKMVQKMGLFHISQTFKGARENTSEQGGFMFYACERIGTRASISVNTKFGFDFFKKQYTYFPAKWAYRLADSAFSLTEYVFSLIRQNAEEIKKNGSFKIKLSTIQDQLGLCSVEEVREKHNRRFNDFIKQPIKQAVEKVNSAAKEDKEIDGHLKITIQTKDDGKIEAWLAGYMVITANGAYTEYLNEIADNKALYRETYKEEKIKAAAKRKARSKKGK
jgi:hypothetical protein